jgi:hypothetical protein
MHVSGAERRTVSAPHQAQHCNFRLGNELDLSLLIQAGVDGIRQLTEEGHA